MQDIQWQKAKISNLLDVFFWFSQRILCGCGIYILFSVNAVAGQKTISEITSLGGDFTIEQDTYSSSWAQGKSSSSRTRLILFYKGTRYWPMAATGLNQVRVLPTTRERQPMLLVNDLGQKKSGTMLIAVKNGTPYARLLSPSADENRPDLGFVQPGRSDILLFPSGDRALSIRTGEVLWFDSRTEYERYGFGALVSVSPDNSCGAYMANTGVTTANQSGPQEYLKITDQDYMRDLEPLSKAAQNEAHRAFKAGHRGFESKRYNAELWITWFAGNVQWSSSGCGITSLRGRSVAIESKASRHD